MVTSTQKQHEADDLDEFNSYAQAQDQTVPSIFMDNLTRTQNAILIRNLTKFVERASQSS